MKLISQSSKLPKNWLYIFSTINNYNEIDVKLHSKMISRTQWSVVDLKLQYDTVTLNMLCPSLKNGTLATPVRS